jgi:hypothetical protein
MAMLLKETSNKINGSRKGLAYLVAAGSDGVGGVEEAGVHRDGVLGAVADREGVQDVRGLLRLLPLVLAASSSTSRMCFL